jgi:hypothetical protein
MKKRKIPGRYATRAAIPMAQRTDPHEEILMPERVNLRIRLRFANGYLLEIHEAVIIAGQGLAHLYYRYHCQDE